MTINFLFINVHGMVLYIYISLSINICIYKGILVITYCFRVCKQKTLPLSHLFELSGKPQQILSHSFLTWPYFSPFHWIALNSFSSSSSSSSSLASGKKNKCTSLVCSCYAPAPKNNIESKEVSSNGYFNEPCLQTKQPLKSNIKKATTAIVTKEEEQQKQRKVTWPDAHGMNLAHVHEFQSR